ncbi:hypothetical protein [Roseicella aerolata]|uniref:Phasin domain-containing protein n=1 Tax=Roseicella aerolata TaxID=2883479 RepID=A0A9X1L720_9PROT|nr:hypothetical protein [Roseicella aerolata]MCB4821094.1 hypothetical protein [Roseicella aerolata]
MAEHKAQERSVERPRGEARAADRRGAEMPSRTGGFARMPTEARLREVPAAAPAEATADDMTAWMQETTRGLRAAMMLPIAPGAGFIEVQEAYAELVTGMMRSNVRLMQEVMRICSPQEHVGLMQQVTRQWLDAVLESQLTLLRLAQERTDEALRPVAAMTERQQAAPR